ncbi:MAG: hypothetical protein ACTHK5_14215 [Tsuneonella sp.]
MTLHDFFAFATDAQIAALWGAGLMGVAMAASFAERRRVRRQHIDRVGWMPWTGVFFVCAVAGIVLVAMSAKGLFAG